MVKSASSTRHLVDPELLAVLDLFPPDPFNAETLPGKRAGTGPRISASSEPSIRPVEMSIAGGDGRIDVFLYDPQPGTRRRAALLHIHGGGMVLGRAREMTNGPSALAAELGIPVVSVEYRLAPETPFPGPQEDCYAALCWLADSADELGIDPRRIALIGESAGGGLAAAVAQMARDRAGPSPAAQILVYPMLDHRVGGQADPWCNRSTGEYVWTRDSNQFGWESLRGKYVPIDARKGWFSPSLAADLAGLPPTWIGVGTLDLFFDEDVDYARRLVDAGVFVELRAYGGAFHGFNILAGSRVAQDFARDMTNGIRRFLKL